MRDTTYGAVAPEKLLQLNVDEHSKALALLWRTRKGHVYVHGATGTGKSIIARHLALHLEADWFCYEQMSAEEYQAGMSDIIARLAGSKKKVLILDGFFPQYAGSAFSALLSELSVKSVSLFIFSQETPFQERSEFYPGAFETIAEFRYGTWAFYPITFHQVK